MTLDQIGSGGWVADTDCRNRLSMESNPSY